MVPTDVIVRWAAAWSSYLVAAGASSAELRLLAQVAEAGAARSDEGLLGAVEVHIEPLRTLTVAVYAPPGQVPPEALDRARERERAAGEALTTALRALRQEAP